MLPFYTLALESERLVAYGHFLRGQPRISKKPFTEHRALVVPPECLGHQHSKDRYHTLQKGISEVALEPVSSNDESSEVERAGVRPNLQHLATLHRT